MKENGELEQKDIEIDDDMEVDCDIGQQITFSMRLWFDVDKKFHLNINAEDSTWLNMYGKYNPYDDSLRIECEIDREKGSSCFDYEPTTAESKLIKDMVAQKLQHRYHQTPKEFCESYLDVGQKMGE